MNLGIEDEQTPGLRDRLQLDEIRCQVKAKLVEIAAPGRNGFVLRGTHQQIAGQ